MANLEYEFESLYRWFALSKKRPSYPVLTIFFCADALTD